VENLEERKIPDDFIWMLLSHECTHSIATSSAENYTVNLSDLSG
jgi:hypothetical protein